MLLQLIKYTHEILGIATLFLVLLIIVYFVIRFVIAGPFSRADRIVALAGMFLMYLQVMLGFLLFFISPVGRTIFSKQALQMDTSRFFILDHPVGMLVATALFHIAFIFSERNSASHSQVYTRVILLYVIGYTFILYATPWFVWEQ